MRKLAALLLLAAAGCRTVQAAGPGKELFIRAAATCHPEVGKDYTFALNETPVRVAAATVADLICDDFIIDAELQETPLTIAGEGKVTAVEVRELFRQALAKQNLEPVAENNRFRIRAIPPVSP